MKFIETEIEGAYIVENFTAKDDRGTFVKTFHKSLFNSIGFNGSFQESYYSISQKDVIRGMHFQMPPFDHEKLVYVTSGEIIDVILDLRINSKMYKKFITIPLKAFQQSVFIPKGCAHGFVAISNEATVVYNVTSVYEQSADAGILWNSFGYEWPVKDPVMSSRDQSFLPLSAFQSPFK